MLAFRNISLGIGCTYIFYRVSAILIRRYFISKLTALNELSEIGTESTRKSEKLRGTVVICGGSFAGLLAAKVCSDHFESVIIVESEEWVTTPEGYTGSHRHGPASRKRSHVSQYRAIHLYKPFLIETLFKWFPNIKEECEKLGGRVVLNYWPLSYSNIPSAKSVYNDRFRTLRLSRAGFEMLVRRLVMTSCKNVRYLAGTALGLEYASDCNLATGVRIRTSNQEEITLPALLAIDCTGPSSAGLRWLRELATAAGDEKAVQELNSLRLTYDPKQSYYTCEFDVPPEVVPYLKDVGFPANWDTIGVVWLNFSDPKLDNKLFGVARKDNNYMEIFCGGWAITEVISDISDIRSFISDTKCHKPVPTWILLMLDVLERHNVPFTVDFSRLGVATYIQYDKYEHMPSNFIAIGDSVMRTNPVMGFGITKACIEALSLNTLLNKCYQQKGGQIDRLPKDFSRRFNKLQVERTTAPEWDSNRLQDYAWESTVPTKGDNPKTFKRFQKALGDWMLLTNLMDAEFAATIQHVRGFLIPPTDLFAPRVLLKILKVKLFYTSPLS